MQVPSTLSQSAVFAATQVHVLEQSWPYVVALHSVIESIILELKIQSYLIINSYIMLSYSLILMFYE